MPYSKSADSLKKLCLRAIAFNMDYWCEDYINNFAGQKTLYVISPFDCLPQELLLNLLSVLKELKLLKRPHLELLLNSRFDCLDLASCVHLDISYLVNLIGRTCTNLRMLDISHCSKIPRSAFLELPLVIPNIITLKLESSGCFDNVLTRIGGHCHEIRELNVSWCPISDAGISSLCINMDEVQTGVRRCPKLEVLSIVGTKITNNGAVCALKNLPLLKRFDFHNSLKALETIHFNDFKEGRLQSNEKYQLQTLNIECENDSFPLENFVLVTELCPFVTSVEITNTNDFTNECLIQLSNFKHLQQLVLTNSLDSSISFSNGVTPLLQLIGQSLLTLTLIEMVDVDINIIGLSCPNLQCLKLLFATSYATSVSIPKNYKGFENLKNLQIVCIEKIDVPPAQLSNLLTRCHNVQYIYFQYCDSLDDEMMANVLNTNPLQHLEHLELEYCNNITATSILSLISLSNPLQVMKLTWCKSITRIDFDCFKDLVKKENLKMSIEWM